VRFSKTFSFWGEGRRKEGRWRLRQLTFTVSAPNVINHPNFGAPNGNQSSAIFGYSTGLLSSRAAGNRRLDLQLRKRKSHPDPSSIVENDQNPEVFRARILPKEPSFKK